MPFSRFQCTQHGFLLFPHRDRLYFLLLVFMISHEELSMKKNKHFQGCMTISSAGSYGKVRFFQGTHLEIDLTMR